MKSAPCALNIVSSSLATKYKASSKKGKTVTCVLSEEISAQISSFVRLGALLITQDELFQYLYAYANDHDQIVSESALYLVFFPLGQ